MSITGSVGLGGKNLNADTRLIQATLNPHAKTLGLDLLEVDGVCGPLTRGAIKRYQQQIMKLPSQDSRVDPGGATLQSLATTPVPADTVFTCYRAPEKLKIGDFVQMPQVIDPADGTFQDAYTAFTYEFPDRGARLVGKDYALGAPNFILVEPDAKVKIGAVLTPALLAHEQFHYDVGFVVCRALAVQLTIARAPSIAELIKTVGSLVDLHINRRVGLIQRRYDRDTQHSQNAYYQKVWLDRMTACLGNPNANQIGGFWL